MNQRKIIKIAIVFAAIASLIFLGLAAEGNVGITLFNNTVTHEKISPNTGESIANILSNLTRPVTVATITAEDIQRIPKVAGTVISSENTNSSE